MSKLFFAMSQVLNSIADLIALEPGIADVTAFLPPASTISAIPGSSAIKSAMLFKTWDIAKNSFDIPTERYWTGAILMKVKGSKWCQYRKFTAHQDYAGGGKYAASKFTFAGLRFQQCK